MNEQEHAALALMTLADLCTTTAALVQLDEKEAALRQLDVLGSALGRLAEGVQAGHDWGKLAVILTETVEPLLKQNPAQEARLQAEVGQFLQQLFLRAGTAPDPSTPDPSMTDTGDADPPGPLHRERPRELN